MSIGTVRTLGSDAGDAGAEGLRRARLAALADSPERFGSSYDEEAAWPIERWREALADADWGLVESDGAPIGLVCLRAAPDTPDADCWISGWWVAPQARGTGVSEALLAWIDGTCGDRDWRRQGLGVWAENDVARRAFARLGFAQRGGVRASTQMPGRRYVRMLRALPGAEPEGSRGSGL